MEKRLTRIKEKVPSEAYDIQTIHEDGMVRFTYRIAGGKGNAPGVYRFNGFVIGDISHVEVFFSYERASDLELAREIFSSVKEIF
jgi:hypothetical protein